MNILRLDLGEKIPKNYTGIIEYPNGVIYYYLNGLRHREDGPSCINYDGTIEYHLNGKCHREDGPAIIYSDGTLEYCLNDKDITDKVNKWVIDNNIPKVWNKSHKLLFKLTFG